ncbi:SDR family oxidoreductase [Alicyclobacillus sp. SO9]|uniref:SDR family oxidoreductase n=1 Tax=Alicyclobacillus sp. SO9 TaxID=2665646 RepID=UPI0018E9084C|nr:SDR family oxidoreductase [Alicyclobacillus sp. SO9]QQE80322.1 SDR family oxidoreductase [Alicyclobacillus sp. SO9]
MKILVLGGDGMAGHMIVDYFRSLKQHEVWFTVRRSITETNPLILHLNAKDKTRLKSVLRQVQPDVVINAIGLLNQDAEDHTVDAIIVNALFPHWLVEYSHEFQYRILHISTDCVFSGHKGSYVESDRKDGTGVYANTKSLGEIDEKSHLTIRTSIIGPEIKADGIGLFEWFMRQSGTISGYSNVFWNGITTLQLAKVLNGLVDRDSDGIIHVFSPYRISKFDLLLLFQEIFEKDDVTMKRDGRVVSDKTLHRLRTDIEPDIPSYKDMLLELKSWMREHPDKYPRHKLPS